MSIPKRIIESFEDIGEVIIQEVKQLPKDIAGKALESLGTASTKKPSASQQQARRIPQDGASAEIEKTKEEQIKKAIARAALEEIAGVTPQKKEPTVFEKAQIEIDQKKELAKKQMVAAQMAQLPKMSQKKRRGNLFGIQEKSSLEKSRNVRQD